MKYQVTLNGKIYEVDVTETDAVITSVSQAVPAAPMAAPAAPAAPVAPAAPAAQTAVSGEKITCPMPGTILSVNTAEGKAVKAGEVLFILEAMKMENEIVAPHDGVVRQVLVSKGATVNTDDVLALM